MSKISIFRFTATSDVETTSDRLDFNTTTKTDVENNFITGFENNPTDGVGNNQGAEQELGDQQALGKVEDIIRIDGSFSKRNGNNDDGQNASLIKLKEWTDGDKINANWELGRFGIIDNDDHTHDLIPIRIGQNQKALLWERLERKTDFKGNRVTFTLYFRINRGDGT